MVTRGPKRPSHQCVPSSAPDRPRGHPVAGAGPSRRLQDGGISLGRGAFDLRRGWSRARVARLAYFAAGGDRPAVDDVSVADDDQLVGEVDGRADVVRDDLDAIADVKSELIG